MTHDEFISLITHELRGPIGALGSAAQVLRASGGAPGFSNEACAIVERQTRKLTEVVHDVHELGKLISPDTEIRREPVDLMPLLRANCDCDAAQDIALVIATDRGRIENAIARVAAEAPSRLRACVDTELTLEPVGGGLAVQVLRVLLEAGGAKVTLEQGTQGRASRRALRAEVRFRRRGRRPASGGACGRPRALLRC